MKNIQRIAQFQVIITKLIERRSVPGLALIGAILLGGLTGFGVAVVLAIILAVAWIGYGSFFKISGC